MPSFDTVLEPDHVKIRNGELKHLMKAALADLLPRDILYRAKRGFHPVPLKLRREADLIVMSKQLTR